MYPISIKSLCSTIWPTSPLGRVRTLAAAAAATYLVMKLIKRAQHSSKFDVSKFSAPPNQVLLHQFTRGRYCINLSPFAIKLETFLRIANIPYMVDSTVPFGPKGKCPWVNLEDGTPLGDSQMIIDTLTQLEQKKSGEKTNIIAADDNLSAKEKAILDSLVIVVDEQLFWCVIYYRYHLDRCKIFLTTQKFPPMVSFMFRNFMPNGAKKKCQMQGIACHTPQEVLNIARKSCRILNDYLGESAFFCGNAPGTADCAIFGGLSQIMWNAPGTEYEALVKEEFPSLSAYCLRMKEKVYPDWEKLLIK